jgi:LmbE family N-acetylglucosaminyl deacetylase
MKIVPTQDELREEMSKNPLWLCNISESSALLIVAHSDDETIFAGGLILSSQNTRWTIVCCFDEGDPRRRHEFLCACRFFNQQSENCVQPDFLGLGSNIEQPELSLKLKVYAKGYDIVLTHNREGEYGNEHHKLVHRSVIESIGNPNTWVFISPGSANVYQDELRSHQPSGKVVLDLSDETIQMKEQCFHECHTSQAVLYGRDTISGEFKESDLKKTLEWYFKHPRKEEYSFAGK